jgi:NAD(P)-dependent dehydrogenase (short-subunit alcohol dehydrogenase family)
MLAAMNDATKRVALVTGANKGLGLAIAKRLAREPMTVLLGARNAEKGERAAAELRAEGLDAQAIAVDVTRADTIAAAAATVEARFGRLDVLVNNAGIADLADGSPTTADLDAIRRVMETNFFGVVAVTRALLPLLRRSPAGRVVNVSSNLGSLALAAPLDSPYGATGLLAYRISKAALNMLTIELARELRGTAIKVNAAAPGYTATDLNAHLPRRASQTVDEAAVVPVRLALLPNDGPTGGFFGKDGPMPW